MLLYIRTIYSKYLLNPHSLRKHSTFKMPTNSLQLQQFHCPFELFDVGIWKWLFEKPKETSDSSKKSDAEWSVYILHIAALVYIEIVILVLYGFCFLRKKTAKSCVTAMHRHIVCGSCCQTEMSSGFFLGMLHHSFFPLLYTKGPIDSKPMLWYSSWKLTLGSICYCG